MSSIHLGLFRTSTKLVRIKPTRDTQSYKFLARESKKQSILIERPKTQFEQASLPQ